MTTICLVRHGETDWNAAGMIQGKTDIPLNERGMKQAEECADYLSEFSWDVIVTSPLTRAKQTTEIINAKLNLPLIEMDEFIERDYGQAEGLSYEDREEKFPNRTYPDAEPREALLERVMNGLSALNQSYHGQNVIVVAHGGVINAILSLLSDGEIGSGKTRLINGCMSYIVYADGDWHIKDYNQVSHLSQYR